MVLDGEETIGQVAVGIDRWRGTIATMKRHAECGAYEDRYFVL